MKKTALVLLLAVAAYAGKAQTYIDALTFSESNYEGTARTLAMGNAFTALGGDLGAVSINPAGSAVAGYSQITFSPGLSISANTAGGTLLPGETAPSSFGNRLTNRATRFSVPNFGAVLNFDTHRTRGIKNISIGFVSNATDCYFDNPMTSGENAETSFMGAEAYFANGYDFGDLLSSDAYNYSSAPWRTILAAQSGMISNLTDAPTEYIGASEVINEGDNSISLGGPLYQSYQRQNYGAKYDYVINFGMNVSDFVYVGANLGITSFNYNSSVRFMESAVDPEDFLIEFHDNETGENIRTYFNDMMYDYRYSANGAGIYGKFGVIVTPLAGLRIGAAIQTPTSLTVNETWKESGSTTYSDSGFDMSSETPLGEYSYRLISPFRANFGLAYTFGTYGLVSIDYELCDYSTMMFKEIGMQSGEFDAENYMIKDFLGTSHMLRAGVEIKPLPAFAIRAGYGLTTAPDKTTDADGNIVYAGQLADGHALTHKVSFGAGYSSNGSFFADIACSMTKYHDEFIYPYDDYIIDASENTVTTFSPEILNRRSLWNVLLTIGFRF